MNDQLSPIDIPDNHVKLKQGTVDACNGCTVFPSIIFTIEVIQFMLTIAANITLTLA